MIDVVATDYEDLFRQIDGTTVEPKGITLADPPGTEVERIKMSAWKSILDLLIDPNIIALMLSIGLIGIVVELWNPGLIFPGTVGAISLIVGLYGLQVLPVSIAGLLLMLLAAGFFVAEAFIVSHGALTLAGAVTFVIGALLLFDPAGRRLPGVAAGRARDRRHAHAPLRVRPDQGRQASAHAARGRRTPAGRRGGPGARREPRLRRRRALARPHRRRRASPAGRPSYA